LLCWHTWTTCRWGGGRRQQQCGSSSSSSSGNVSSRGCSNHSQQADTPGRHARDMRRRMPWQPQQHQQQQYQQQQRQQQRQQQQLLL
jgi:hypothetical protein